jgi:protein SCO1
MTAAILVMAASAACTRSVDFHGQALVEPLPAAPLALSDGRGATFDLAKERGRVVVLYFGYTHCPDMCPTMLADWARVRSGLGRDAGRVRFVFVTTDPERDTPAVASAYARQFDSTFVGLSGLPGQVAAVQKGWGIGSVHQGMTPDGGYGVDHPAQAFVVDRQGRVVLIFPPGSTVEHMTDDLRRLL